jgi:hypothetical protein
VDYWEIPADEFRTLGLRNHGGGTHGILLSQSGYCMVSKSFMDDKAWDVQRHLVNHYFRSEATLPTQYKAIGDAVAVGIVNGCAEVTREVKKVTTEVGKLGNRVGSIEGKLDELRYEVESSTRRRRKDLSATTKRNHIDTVGDFFSGKCPCCGERHVLDEHWNKLTTAHWDHWFAPHRHGPQETWLVCSECNQLMKNHRARNERQTFFDAYQLRLNQKHYPIILAT